MSTDTLLFGEALRSAAAKWRDELGKSDRDRLDQQILSGSSDESLKVWDARSGQCLLTLSCHGSLVTACAWSPDGQRLRSGSSDKSLKVWDALSGHCLWSGLLLVHASPEAWRWLGWRSMDPDTQRMRILPA